MTPVRTMALAVHLRDHAVAGNRGLLREIVAFFRQFIVAAFDPYQPERHYMRGPGPACRARRESDVARPTRM